VITYILIIATIFLAACTWYDYSTKNIPNWLILIGFTIGVFINIWYLKGLNSWLVFGAIELAFILLIIFVPEKYIGGGDLKIYAVLYAIFPSLSYLLYLILLSSLFGYIYSVFKKKVTILFADFILLAHIIISIYLII